MNYYNNPFFNEIAADDNGNVPTLLPYTAYNDYEDEYKQLFTETIDIKHRLDEIVFNSVDVSTEPETDELEQVAYESIDDMDDNANDNTNDNADTFPEGINTSHLEFEFTQPEPDEQQEFLTAVQKLEQVADTRDDIHEFIEYLCEKYDINPEEQLDDLPFPVIDEIMAYIDYDPDTSPELDLTAYFTTNDDQIIIPPEHTQTFSNLLEDFKERANRLEQLQRINGINDSRYDSTYHKFQQIFKPTLEPLIRLYKHYIRDYQSILNDSLRESLNSIDWDNEYDDYDY